MKKDALRSRGVIYCGYNIYEFVEESAYSCKTFKKFHPDIPATLFTNLSVKAEHRKYFDEVIHIDLALPKFVFKVYCLMQSLYNYSLFLDSDTEVRQSVYELFDSLDYYDFIFTRAIEFDFTATPYIFKNYMDQYHCNSGVILFKNSISGKKFLEHWYKITSTVQFERDVGRGKFMSYDDQMALNYLLHKVHYDRDINMKTLYLPGKIYNAVTYAFPYLKKDKQYHLIKIAHGHELIRQQLQYKITDKVKKIKKKYLSGDDGQH